MRECFCGASAALTPHHAAPAPQSGAAELPPSGAAESTLSRGAAMPSGAADTATDGAELRAWETRLQTTLAACWREKCDRIATLRRVRQRCGAVSEAEVRFLLTELLRQQYQSAIFGETIMKRLGWSAAVAENAAAAPEIMTMTADRFGAALGA
jgi:hypothetical protein